MILYRGLGFAKVSCLRVWGFGFFESVFLLLA